MICTCGSFLIIDTYGSFCGACGEEPKKCECKNGGE